MSLRSPQKSPDFALHRESIDANDGAGPHTDVTRGINMDGYEHAIIQVLPDAGDAPVVEVLFWSPEAGRFVSEHTALTFAAKAAGVPWQAVVPVYGRVMFVQITSGIVAGGDGTKIAVAGFNRLHPE
jgi:hypothetical protein